MLDRPHDYMYLCVIIVLAVMLLISNGRMTQYDVREETAARLCETSSRILDERIKELAAQIERAEEERLRLLGLTSHHTEEE